MPRVSITEARFGGQDRDDVEAEFRDEAAQTFQELRDNGEVERAFFVVDRRKNKAIGIAIYTSDEALQRVEGQPGMEVNEDPDEAPTNLGKRRARTVRRSKAKMERTEHYDLITEI